MTTRRWGLGFVAVSSLLTGCADNNSTVFIRQVQAVSANNECTVTNDPSAAAQPSGFLDVALGNLPGGNGYQAALLFGNQQVLRADADTLRVETARVQIYEAEVEVFDFSGATIYTSVQPTTGFADPGQGLAPGWGLAGVRMLDTAAVAGLTPEGTEQEFVSRVRLRGENLGGLEVETGPFDFPIRVCNGCTTVRPVASCDDDLEIGCFPAQEGEVDARVLDPSLCSGML